MKIDAEGHELPVLHGMRRLIEGDHLVHQTYDANTTKGDIAFDEFR